MNQGQKYPGDHGKSPGYSRQWVGENVNLGLNGDLADVRRLLALGAIHDLEFHLLSLTQRAESRALNGGIMYEDIIAIRTFDEPVTLCVIKPFYLTSEPHFRTSSCTLGDDYWAAGIPAQYAQAHRRPRCTPVAKKETATANSARSRGFPQTSVLQTAYPEHFQ